MEILRSGRGYSCQSVLFVEFGRGGTLLKFYFCRIWQG